MMKGCRLEGRVGVCMWDWQIHNALLWSSGTMASRWMEDAKQGAAGIEERKEIEIRIMQIKIKRHAQNNQNIAIPTKIGMQSKQNLWKASKSSWGRGEGKDQIPSNQKASVMKLPKERDYVRKEMHATYKKVLHAGVQKHSRTHS